MRVLVACEFSGVVREAFRARGHDAWSCDLLPSEIPSGRHFEMHVERLLEGDDDWDLLIAHPPCTYLAVSGARWLKSRRHEQIHALEFVRTLLTAGVPRIALENPVGVISTMVRKPDQIIQPWQFGHGETKATVPLAEGTAQASADECGTRPAGTCASRASTSGSLEAPEPHVSRHRRRDGRAMGEGPLMDPRRGTLWQRFWPKVQLAPNGCWIWQGARGRRSAQGARWAAAQRRPGRRARQPASPGADLGVRPSTHPRPPSVSPMPQPHRTLDLVRQSLPFVLGDTGGE
jgi:hypothetical protein